MCNPPSSSPVTETLARIAMGLDAFVPASFDYEVVSESALPDRARSLLAHTQHMTNTLRTHYDADITLDVKQDHLDDSSYRRLITLLIPDNTVVELGMVAIDLAPLPPAVQGAIRARRRPLGDILIGSDVLREIEPRWFLKIPGNARNLVPWGLTFDYDLYGRVAVMHCDGHPAIELLEIVT